MERLDRPTGLGWSGVTSKMAQLLEAMVPRTPATQSFDDGNAMDSKPIDGFGEDGRFEAVRNEFWEATSPELAEAGPRGVAPQNQGDGDTPAPPQPSELGHQSKASRRDWITTW